jgi:hypothetical protein
LSSFGGGGGGSFFGGGVSFFGGGVSFFGGGGGGGGGKISMHKMELPPLQRIFRIIFSGQQQTTVIVTVFFFSSKIWSCISIVHKSQHHIQTQSFFFLALSIDGQPYQITTTFTHTQKYTKKKRLLREGKRETHEGIYIELSSPSCSNEGTEDQPSATFLLSPLKVLKL